MYRNAPVQPLVLPRNDPQRQMSGRSAARFPEFNGISFGVVDSSEPPDPHRIPFFIGDDVDPCSAQVREQAVEVANPEVHHRRAVEREIVAVLLEGFEHHRAALVEPHPFVRLATFIHPAAAADAEMLTVPGLERRRILGAEEISPHSDYGHFYPPRTLPCPRSVAETASLRQRAASPYSAPMAAPILSYEGLGLIQGEGWLFRGLDLYIGKSDRLALIGRNGAGKTTLLKCLAGLIDPDDGKRTIVPGTHVVLLEQDPAMDGYDTLQDWVLHGEDAPEAHEADSIADQLGVDLGRPVTTASGGERRRAAITRALAQKPDVLLLDEPTNHLDLGAIEWLEEWLKRFSGAFIVISHDRTFLTRLTRSCIWLDRGQLRRAEIGFGGFEAWTERVYEEEARAAEKLDAKLKIELHWLQRGVTARRRRNQGRLAKLHEMRAQRAAMLGAAGTAKLALAKDDVRSKTVIDADRVSKAYGERAIIKDFSLRVQRGDRIGIVGPNGAGKTTLLNLLTGELAPDSGTVTVAKTLSGIVIDQQRKLMEPQKRVRDVLAQGGDW